MKPTRPNTPKQAKPPLSTARSPRWPLLAASLLALAVALGLGVTLTRKSPVQERADATAPAVAAPTVARSNPDLLAGRWLRTDGDYVIEIRRVRAHGKLEAAYFNPRPIHVARAESVREGDLLRVSLVLEDTGYPGCHYTLVHDPKQDRLKGTYFQAALGQEFDVEFVRMDARP
jgi:hypothetical protein